MDRSWDGERWTDRAGPAEPAAAPSGGDAGSSLPPPGGGTPDPGVYRPAHLGVIGSGRLASAGAAPARGRLGPMVLPSAVVVAGFAALFTFAGANAPDGPAEDPADAVEAEGDLELGREAAVAAYRVDQLPTAEGAERIADTFSSQLAETFELDVTESFAGSDPSGQVVDGAQMSLAVCGPQTSHRELTSIFGTRLHRGGSELLLMLGTGDQPTTRAFHDTLAEQAETCTNPGFTSDTVEADGGRALTATYGPDGDGRSWVLVARDLGDAVAAGFVRHDAPVTGGQLADDAQKVDDALDLQVGALLDVGALR